MSQQINLYQPILRRQPKVFSAATMLQIVLIVALGLGALYGYGYWQLHQQRQELAALRVQKETAKQRLERLKTEYPKPRKSTRLQQRAESLAAEYRAKGQLLSLLEGRSLEATEGFSEYLQGLARRDTAGLWLTRFSIGGHGRHLMLSGRAQHPEAVPRLLQQLRSEPRFAGKRFERLLMERPENDEAELAFLIRGGPKPGKGDER